MDPESEALIRKLHRELNGLTRSTRGGDRGNRSSSLRPKGEQQQPPGGGNPKKKATVSSGSDASSSGSEEKDKEGERPSKKQKKPDHGAAPDPRTQPKHSKGPSPSKTTSTGPDVVKKDPDLPPKKQHLQHDKVQEVHIKQEPGVAGPALAKPQVAPVEQDAPASSHPAAAAPPAPPAPVVYKTPMEAAAAAASTIVKDKVKALSSRGRALEGQRAVKCFHAGVRWGISLAAAALKTRADLATALNDAFAGEILSCGRGDILNIVFLDGDGRVTEFPSLRNSGARDSSTKWKSSVERAVKIYVRRG